jgi:PKD repeat protein
LDGSGLKQVTFKSPENPHADIPTAISGDGSKITWSERLNGNLYIFVVNSDGSGYRQLTTGNDRSYDPSISYDGSKIAFASDISGKSQIYLWTDEEVPGVFVADFKAAPNSGFSPLTVGFTDLSRSPEIIGSWDWDFNDDGTVDSTDKNPTYTYNSSGVYTVSLTVRKLDGDTASKTKRNYVVVEIPNELPVADSGGPYVGEVVSPILFNGENSYDPDGSIILYEWSFGDGKKGEGVNPIHSYSFPGAYIIILTVTDDLNATNTSTATATIVSTIEHDELIRSINELKNWMYIFLASTIILLATTIYFATKKKEIIVLDAKKKRVTHSWTIWC